MIQGIYHVPLRFLIKLERFTNIQPILRSIVAHSLHSPKRAERRPTVLVALVLQVQEYVSPQQAYSYF